MNFFAVNLMRYVNPEYDNIFEQAMIEQNESERLKLFLQLEKILKDDVPAIYLHHGIPQYYIAPIFVQGLKVRFGILDYSEVWMEQRYDKNK